MSYKPFGEFGPEFESKEDYQRRVREYVGARALSGISRKKALEELESHFREAAERRKREHWREVLETERKRRQRKIRLGRSSKKNQFKRNLKRGLPPI